LRRALAKVDKEIGHMIEQAKLDVDQNKSELKAS